MSVAGVTAVEVAEQTRYRLVLPPTWVRLPMEASAMRTAARAWLLRRYAAAPRDRTATLRRELVEDLVALTRRAGAEYSRMLLVLAVEAQGRPISASCLVSVLPHPLPDEASLQALAAMHEDALEVSVTELGGSRGVVVVRDEVQPLSVPAGAEAEVQRIADQVVTALGVVHDGPAEPWEPGRQRLVEVYLPVPDRDDTLLLAFATPLVPLFPALTELFVLMACSVQWQADDGSWG